MKSKLNLWLLFSFLIATVLTLWLYLKLNEHVGDISYDSAIDSAEYSPCGEYRIYQYYNIDTHYQGGIKAIKKVLLPKIRTEKLPKNGLLTVRFVVNCHGRPGYFRTNMIDSGLEDIKVSADASNHLYALISELKDWVPGQIQGEPMDSYVQIVFKLEQGKVIDIF